jgi:hypothetical protein
VGLGGGPVAGGAGIAALGATGTAVPGAGILAKVAVVSVLAAGGTVAGEELMRGGAGAPPRGAENAAPAPSAGAPGPIPPLETDSIGSRPDTGVSARPRANGPPARSAGPERGRTTSHEARGGKPAAPPRPAIPGNRAPSHARPSGQGEKKGAAHHPTGGPPAAPGRPASSGHAEQVERDAKPVRQPRRGDRQAAVPQE